MDRHQYDEFVEVSRLSPVAPTIIWGALMVVALLGAGATVLLRSGVAGGERLVADAPVDATLKRDVAKLAAERNELAGRLASLERGLGELKFASRAKTEQGAQAAQEAQAVTGSISRQNAATFIEPRPGVFGLSLGRDASPDAIKRRWGVLSARHSATLAKLSPRAQRNAEQAGMFDLVAGPFPSRADADRACSTLAEQGLACDTTVYGGEPIGRP